MKPHEFLFDWGDTIMVDYPEYYGPMYKWPRVKVVCGVHEALGALSKRSRLSLVTNAQDSTESEILEALKRVELAHYFENIFCYSNIGCLKSEAGYFEKVLSTLSTKPENVIMVGDSYEKDILPANKNGMYGIWLKQTGESASGKLYKSIFSMLELCHV